MLSIQRVSESRCHIQKLITYSVCVHAALKCNVCLHVCGGNGRRKSKGEEEMNAYDKVNVFVCPCTSTCVCAVSSLMKTWHRTKDVVSLKLTASSYTDARKAK